jgi:hypothetical protein
MGTMRKLRPALRVAFAGTALAASASCGSASAPTSSTSNTTAMVARTAAQAILAPTEDGLHAAAITYTNAFLLGSYRDLITVLDPTCVPKTATALNARIALGDAELRHFQALVKQHSGIDATKIEIRTVDVRNFQGRAGDAQAEYGLPVAVEGNDNWNSYAYSGGRWHIAGCDMKFPMGGQGSGKSATNTP